MLNEHSCRLSDPQKYDSFTRKNCAEKDEDRCIDHIYGIKDGKSEIQALRYNKKIWTESSARSHCDSRDGTFEAASKESDQGRNQMKLSYRNEKNAHTVASYWKRPLAKIEYWKVENSTEIDEEILLYDIIGWPFNDAFEVVNYLRSVKNKDIRLKINTPGGDFFDGLAIYAALIEHGGNVTTQIDSLAASIGSVIALGGKERQAYKSAMMMIHDPWTIAAGNQYDFRELADVLKKISGNLIDIYADKSNIGKRDIKTMMKDETWFTAEEMKENGFIDTIIEGNGTKAKFDLSVFAKVPEGFEGQKEGRELTVRETERALRNAGASRTFAKTVASVGCSGVKGDDQTLTSVVEEEAKDANQWDTEIADNLKTIISNIRGGYANA